MRRSRSSGALLLDTCAMIWFANGDRLAPRALEAVERAGESAGVFVSPISAWEIGVLSRPRSNRRAALQFLPDPETWFEQVLAGPGFREAPFGAGIAIAASYLPGSLHGDPADRLLLATARHLDVPIVTRDQRILVYGGQGHVQVLAC
jgi:PIN domain nuclease of toxin-antitoxin system